MAQRVLRLFAMQGTGRRFVYILQSAADPGRHYTGIAADPQGRLAWHNAGPCGYTVAYRPWLISVTIEFPTEKQALRFERYLKSGSGLAFAKRHFAPRPDSN
jgi:predicted GIY-YIG superfamily endonuclease